MTKEQEKSIEILTKKVDRWKCERPKNPIIFNEIIDEIDAENNAIETVLNMLKEKDKEIEKLKEYIDYQILCDFLINSVSDEEEPIWTEKRIEELLENFEMRWKDAHK